MRNEFSQIVWVNFRGAQTDYAGEILTINQVSVADSQISEERISGIIARLNALFIDENIQFSAECPADEFYSTIHIGKTDAFSALGDFSGLAETIDSGNRRRNDNAFVMMDYRNSDEEIINAISHETGHIVCGTVHNEQTGTIADFALETNSADIDDTFSQARSITNGYVDDSISSSTDVDMYKFTVAAGSRVTFSTASRNGSSLDTYIRVFGSDGIQLAYDDDSGDGYFSSLSYTFNTAGTYYIGVSNYGNRGFNPTTGSDSGSGGTGNYRLNVSGIITPSTATNDPDDTFAEARTVSNGTFNDSISTSTDVDMYKFTVAAGNRVTFTTSALTSDTVDTYLRLFNASGTQLTSNDDGGIDRYSQFSYTFNTAGTYYLGVSNYGNRGFNPTTGADSGTGGTGTYNLAISGITSQTTTGGTGGTGSTGDTDDTIAEARTVTNGYVDDTISISSDVDMYKFTVAAGSRVTFTTSSRNSSSLDTYLRLFNASGTQLSYDDDSGDGYFSSLSYTFNTAGTYYIGVSNYGNRGFNPTTGADSGTGGTGAYRLNISGITAPTATSSDSDDTIAEARTVTNGTVSDSISTSTDVDMYKFTVAAGSRVTFTTSVNGSTNVDTYLRLFNASGTQLSYDDDSGDGYFSSLSYTFNTAGTYYIGVSNYGNRGFNPTTGADSGTGGTGSYNLTISGITLQTTTSSDSDDTIAEARTVTNGYVDDTISTSTDVDMYKFTVAAGSRVTFTTSSRNGSSLDTYIKIFNSTGTQLSYDDDSGDGCFSSLSYTFNTAGTYYIGVSNYGNRGFNPTTGADSGTGGTGAYRLNISGITTPQTTSTGDADDTIAEARTISNGTVRDSIATGNDVDMYKFTVAAGNRVTFTTSAYDTNRVDTYIRLFNSSGTQLAYNDDVNYPANAYSSLSYTFLSAGTYYLGVSNFGNRGFNPTTGADSGTGGTGNYSLTVSGITTQTAAAGDPDDTIAEARTISNGSVSDSISTSTDVDMYKFTVAAGSRVTFTTSAFDSNEVDTYIRLFNASGTQLTYNDDGGTGYYSNLSYTFNTAGTYYLGISNYSNRGFNPTTGADSGTGGTGNYLLTVSGISAPAAVSGDSDDQIAEARTVSNGTVSDRIDSYTDVDMYKFTVSAGNTVTFSTASRTSDTVDTFIRLFTSSGTQLTYNDDGGTGYYSSFSYTFNTAGTYYLGVSNYGNRGFNPTTGADSGSGDTGDYNLTISGINISTAASLLSQAQDLGTVGSALLTAENRTISNSSQVHMYKITVAAGQRVYFDIDRAAQSSLDSYLRIFNASGSVLAYNDDSAAPGESSTYDSYLAYTFNTAGTYYIGVSAYGNSSYNPSTSSSGSGGRTTGNYSLSIGLLTSGDSDDQISEALNLTVGSPVSGSLSDATDVDMYKLTVSAGQKVKFKVDLGTLSDSYLRIFNASGSVLAYNDDISCQNRGSEIEYTFTTAGTYYAGVSAYGNTQYSATTGSGDTATARTGTYTITATTQTAADDRFENNDSMASAANLGTFSADSNGEFSGLIMRDGADWYKFTLSGATGASGNITIDFKDSEGDLDIVLYNSSGSIIGSSAGCNNRESISLANLNAGTYYVKVYGYQGVYNPDYTLSYTTSARPVPTTPATPPSTPGGSTAEPANGSNYVLLFAGGYNSWNNHDRYYNNIRNMYRTLVAKGIDADNIYVLYADGTNSDPDRSSGYNSDMSFASQSHVMAGTSSNLANVFNTLAVTITENDNFFFYSFDHGGEYGSSDTLTCWGSQVTDTTFASYARSINAAHSTYIMAQCYSGGMIEDITLTSNMFLASAANNRESSWGSGYADAIQEGLSRGIFNTYELHEYAVNHDPYAAGGDAYVPMYSGGQLVAEHPEYRGYSFDIFQGLSSNSNALDDFYESDSANSADSDLANNNSGIPLNNKVENSAPSVTSVSVKDSEDRNITVIHADEVVFLSAAAADADGDTITKITYSLVDSDGKNTTIGIVANGETLLWRIPEDTIPGNYKLSVTAEDEFSNISTAMEKNIVLKAVDTEPEIRNMTISAERVKLGDTVTVSGQVVDNEGDAISGVSIFLDVNANGYGEHPDEFLQTVAVDSNGNWSYEFNTNQYLSVGAVTIIATPMNDVLWDGKPSSLNLVLEPGLVGNVISWKGSEGDSIRISENQTNSMQVKVSNTIINVVTLDATDRNYIIDGAETEGIFYGISETDPLQVDLTEDQIADIVFARTNGIWDDQYAAQHVGSSVTSALGITAELDGKNKIVDIFNGSGDADALVLTDSDNGDALFLEDLYSAIAQDQQNQARLTDIDRVFAGAGDDIVDITSRQIPGSGNSIKIYGGAGNDVIWANQGTNYLMGDDGNDCLAGASGNDILAGGSGDDTLYGLGGNDTFVFCDNWGNDTVQQIADGNVTLWFTKGSSANWNAATNTFTYNNNQVVVSGVANSKISLKFGNDNSEMYQRISAAGLFQDAATQKIFDQNDRGIIVSF